MNLWQRYIPASSVAEALQALASEPGPALPIAGGTDLLLDLDQGRHPPAHTLVDLNSIDELSVVEPRGDQLFVGAAVPLNRIVHDPLVRQHAEALVEACELIGGPQVRNVATLGGNVAHALPAADGTIALLALDAEAEIASRAGRRRSPLKDLFLGPGQSALKPSLEILVGFYTPLRTPGQASSFRRIMRPQGVALPIINLAVWLQVASGVIEGTRIAVGPGAGVPWRAEAAESVLRGARMSADAVQVAATQLLTHVAFRSSPLRASAEYRRHLAVTLLEETLNSAWERALG